MHYIGKRVAQLETESDLERDLFELDNGYIIICVTNVAPSCVTNVAPSVAISK